MSSKKLTFFAVRLLNVRQYCQKSVTKIPTLYVPGRYGNDMYQIVKPLIDANSIINNLEEIKLNCTLRNIAFNSDGLIDAVTKWKELKEKVQSLSKCYNDLMCEMEKLNPDDEKYKKLNKKLEVDYKELHGMRLELYDLEDFVMPLFHAIPNKLHSKTPISDAPRHIPQESEFDFDIKSHSVIGQELGYLEFSAFGSTAYYLTGKLAVLEQAIQNFFSSHLQCLNYVPLFGTDFCKSFVSEGCGKNPYCESDCIVLKPHGREVGQQINVVGSSSLESLCAYFINMNMESSLLPIKYFSLGRFYNPAYRNGEKSLFSVLQSNCVHCIIVSETSDADTYFDDLSTAITSVFSQLGLPFRTLDVSAKNLNPIESRKVCVEVWSPHLKKYIFCSDVIQCNDFVSKRLQMTYGTDYQKNGYLNVVHGTFVTIPTLIGCIMENMQNADGTFCIPNLLQKYMI